MDYEKYLDSDSPQIGNFADQNHYRLGSNNQISNLNAQVGSSQLIDYLEMAKCNVYVPLNENTFDPAAYAKKIKHIKEALATSDLFAGYKPFISDKYSSPKQDEQAAESPADL